MNELSIEEKAKRYDEALKVAKDINSGCASYIPDGTPVIKAIFPELSESEDERIRKELICFLETEIPQCNARDKYIAWLEKQGEQNYKIIKGKNYFCIKTHNYAGVKWIKGTKYYASDNYTLVNQGCECYCPEYSKEEHNNLFEEVKYDGCVEKQGEQKPNCCDGQKPKTHNGSDNPYDMSYPDAEGYISKRGFDVPWCDCDVFVDNRYITQTVGNILRWADDNPKQKPAEWSEEDKKRISSILLSIEDCEEQYPNLREYQYDIDWLKTLKDRVQPLLKQEWSEKDEKMLSNTIKDLVHPWNEYIPDRIEEEIKWLKNKLKSLRPQNWTKKDTERYISCLQRLGTDNPEQSETINSKWFKEHVYPQTSWKPSDAQIASITCAVRKMKESACYDSELVSLFNDLKKLKDE